MDPIKKVSHKRQCCQKRWPKWPNS